MTIISLLNRSPALLNELNAQGSDTTGDAMKYSCRYNKKSLPVLEDFF